MRNSDVGDGTRFPALNRVGAFTGLRFWLLALAVLTLVAAWPLNQRVSALRIARNEGSSAAKADFGRWHAASLLLNFSTFGLVTAATGMLAFLPTTTAKKE